MKCKSLRETWKHVAQLSYHKVAEAYIHVISCQLIGWNCWQYLLKNWCQLLRAFATSFAPSTLSHYGRGLGGQFARPSCVGQSFSFQPPLRNDQKRRSKIHPSRRDLSMSNLNWGWNCMDTGQSDCMYSFCFGFVYIYHHLLYMSRQIIATSGRGHSRI